MADVFDVQYKERSAFPGGYIKPGSKVLEGSKVPDIPLQVNMSFLLVERTTAETLCPFVNPLGESLSLEKWWPAPPAPSVGSCYPAVTLNQFGVGKAVCIATEVFSDYWRHDTPTLKWLVARCLDLVTPSGGKVIEVRAPPSVEVFLYERGEDEPVRLVNYHAERRETGVPNIEYVPELRGIEVRLQSPEMPKGVVQIPENKALKWTLKEGVLTFKVPSLHPHSCIVVKY